MQRAAHYICKEVTRRERLKYDLGLKESKKQKRSPRCTDKPYVLRKGTFSHVKSKGKLPMECCNKFHSESNFSISNANS